MGFRKKIKYFLVHNLPCSNKEAELLISSGRVSIEGKAVTENVNLDEISEICLDQKILRSRRRLRYFKFYKPKGFESTMNPQVPDNLLHFIKEPGTLAIAGRLDKASEGLLLLSDDGKWVEEICNPLIGKEKEYQVSLDQTFNEDLMHAFKNGVLLGKYTTLPAKCFKTGEQELRIFLKEGKNRQIRRICHKFGFKVVMLKRLRIDNYHLNDLMPGEYQAFEP